MILFSAGEYIHGEDLQKLFFIKAYVVFSVFPIWLMVAWILNHNYCLKTSMELGYYYIKQK